MNISPDNTIGRIATEYPPATRVFARHGIDFCCGGDQPLADACETQGLDVGAVLTEIEVEMLSSGDRGVRWDEAPLGDLVEHILLTHHQALDATLPRLEALSRELVHEHGDERPELPAELLQVYLRLVAQVRQHMAKEEEFLFPLIVGGRGRIASVPISAIRDEHESAARALTRLRELTGNYRLPAGACHSWRSLWDGLEALETSLREHIHLENNILFPRALAEVV